MEEPEVRISVVESRAVSLNEMVPIGSGGSGGTGYPGSDATRYTSGTNGGPGGG